MLQAELHFVRVHSKDQNDIRMYVMSEEKRIVFLACAGCTEEEII